MSNPNNCETCDHHQGEHEYEGQRLHCYMFKAAPADVCMQHTARKVVIIGASPSRFGSPELMAKILAHTFTNERSTLDDISQDK